MNKSIYIIFSAFYLFIFSTITMAKNGLTEIGEDSPFSKKTIIRLVQEKKWEEALKGIEERHVQMRREAGKLSEGGKFLDTIHDFASAFLALKITLKSLEKEKQNPLYAQLISKKEDIEKYNKIAKYQAKLNKIQNVATNEKNEETLKSFINKEIADLKKILRSIGLKREEQYQVAVLKPAIDALTTAMEADAAKRSNALRDAIRNQIQTIDAFQNERANEIAAALKPNDPDYIRKILATQSTINISKSRIIEQTGMTENDIDKLLELALMK